MDIIFNSITELTKYKIVNHINSGDKVLDNLLVAVALGCFTLLSANLKTFVSYCFVKILYWMGRTRSLKTGIILHPHLIPKHDPAVQFFFRIRFQSDDLVEIVCQWIMKMYPNANYGGKRHMSIKTLKFDDLQTYNACIWRNFDQFPIFQDNQDILYAHCTTDDHFEVCCNIQSTFKLFLEQLPNADNKEEILKKNAVVPALEVIDPLNKDAVVCTINPHRTFDTLIFKEKANLLQHYDKFKRNILSTNVFRPKNIGILCFGAYGTGKSSIVKASCNYFQRPAAMFNFKQQRKAKEFIQAMNRCCKTHILVFDELDFLLQTFTGGIRTDNHRDQHLTVLQSQLKDCADKELANQLRQTLIMSLNSGDEADLDMATFLTVMDGLYEHEKRIIIATTNNPQNIPSSWLRSGRFDLKLYLDRYEQEEYVGLLSLIFQDELNASPELQLWLKEQRFPHKVWAPADIIQLAQACENLKHTVEQLQQTKPTLFITMDQPPPPRSPSPINSTASTDSDSESSFIKFD